MWFLKGTVSIVLLVVQLWIILTRYHDVHTINWNYQTNGLLLSQNWAWVRVWIWLCLGSVWVAGKVKILNVPHQRAARTSRWEMWKWILEETDKTIVNGSLCRGQFHFSNHVKESLRWEKKLNKCSHPFKLAQNYFTYAWDFRCL